MVFIFAVLKLIGYALLFLLILLTVLLLAVLFCPIVYKISAKGKDARAIVHWLFGIISFRWEYKDGKARYHLGLPFISNKRGGSGAKKRKQGRAAAEQSDSPPPDTAAPPQTEPAESVIPEEKLIEKTESEPAAEEREEETNTGKAAGTAETAEKDEPDKPEKKENILRKIRRIYSHPDRKLITKNAKRLIKSLFRALKPAVFKLTGEIGFSDPYTTGCFLAGAAALKPILGANIKLYGNFEEEVFNINFYMRGRIFICRLLWPCIRFVFTNPERRLIWRFIKQNRSES